MQEITYQKLDIKNENDLIEYEKGLYNAFSESSWHIENYKVVEENRMRPVIPYSDLIVFIIKYNSHIIAAMTINTNLDRLQLVNFGFEKPTGNNYFEGLNLFMHPPEGINTFNIMVDLYNKLIVPYLQEHNIACIYSICQEKLLPLYKLSDWETVSSKEILGEKRYLIKLDVRGGSLC